MSFIRRIDFDYPIEIQEFVRHGPRTLVSRTGNPNKFGYKLLSLLSDSGIDHFKDKSLNEIKYLISQNLSCVICNTCMQEIRWQNLIRGAVYCSMSCYKENEDAKNSLSKIKTELYQNSLWKKSVEDKKQETCLQRFGVCHPMQNPEIFRKHEKSSRQSYSHRGIDGVRGYENRIIDWLIDVKGFAYKKHFLLGSEAKQIFGQKIKANGGHRYPDLYIIPWNTYIEVKSDYTLSKFDIFEELHDSVEDVGSDYMCLLYENNKIYSVSPYTRQKSIIYNFYD